MTNSTKSLFQLLLILFAFDVGRKFLLNSNNITPTQNNQTSKKQETNNISNKKKSEKILIEDDEQYDEDEFVVKKREPKKIPEKILEKENKNEENILIINYDTALYKNQFNQLKKEITGNFSNLIVVEKAYPLPDMKKFLSRFVYFTQIFASGLLFYPKYLKQSLPFLSDGMITGIEKNKWYLMIGNFIFHFWLNRQLIYTGAFEISYKGKDVFSKLKNKYIPKESDIHNILENLLNSKGEIDKNEKKAKKEIKITDDDDDF